MSSLPSSPPSKQEVVDEVTKFFRRLPEPRFHDYEIADLRKFAEALKTGFRAPGGLAYERAPILVPIVELGFRIFFHYRNAIFSRAGALLLLEHSIDDLAGQGPGNLVEAGQVLESLIESIPAAQIIEVSHGDASQA